MYEVGRGDEHDQDAVCPPVGRNSMVAGGGPRATARTMPTFYREGRERVRDLAQQTFGMRRPPPAANSSKVS